MTKRSWQGTRVRTTITLDRKLVKELGPIMERNGFRDNFSAFVEHALREKKAKLHRQEQRNGGLNT